MPFNCSRFLAAFYGYLSPLSCSFNRTRVLQRLLLITATNRLHLLTQPANVAYTSWAKNLLLVLLSVFAMIRTITNGRRRHQQTTTTTTATTTAAVARFAFWYSSYDLHTFFRLICLIDCHFLSVLFRRPFRIVSHFYYLYFVIIIIIVC